MNALAFVFAVGCGWGVWSVLEWKEIRAQHEHLRQKLRPFEMRPQKFRRFSGRSRLQGFADFLDLLAVGMSAGLIFDQAWTMAVDHLPKNSLKEELKLFERSLQFGKPRSEAMKELVFRWKEPQLKMTAALMEQAMKRGNQIQDALMDQARVLRQARFNELEKRAQTASLRLLFPIYGFILPAIFLILLGPLFIRLSQGTFSF